MHIFLSLRQVYSSLSLPTFVHIRVVFWVHGASQPTKDQNSGKHQLCASFCKRLPSLSPYFTNANPTLNSSILIVVISLVNVAYLSWRNKVKKRPEERAKLLDKYKLKGAGDDDDDEGGRLDAWMELGDRHPDFVYILWGFFFFCNPTNFGREDSQNGQSCLNIF